MLGPWEQAGTLTATAAAELGLPAGTPVAAGTGDNMAGALGIGLRPGEVAVSIGTSGTVFATSERPVRDPTGAIAGFADATGRYLPLVCTLNAALVTEAIGRLLAVDHSGLDDLALAAPSGSGGLVLVPYLAGERTPNRPDATGPCRASGPTSPASCWPGPPSKVWCAACWRAWTPWRRPGCPPTPGRLVLLGGGARSAAYRQVLATLSGRPVTVPHRREIVSAGAALQAAVLATGSDPGDGGRRLGPRDGARSLPPGPETAGSEEIRHRFAAARG